MVKRKISHEPEFEAKRSSTEESTDTLDDSASSSKMRRVRKKSTKLIEMEEFEEESIKVSKTGPMFSPLPRFAKAAQKSAPLPPALKDQFDMELPFEPDKVDDGISLPAQSAPSIKNTVASPPPEPKSPVLSSLFSTKDSSAVRNTSKVKSKAAISGKVMDNLPLSPKKPKMKQLISTPVKRPVVAAPEDDDDGELPASVIKLLLSSPTQKTSLKRTNVETSQPKEPLTQPKEPAEKKSPQMTEGMAEEKPAVTPLVTKKKKKKSDKDKAKADSSSASPFESKLKMKIHLGNKPTVKYETDDSKSVVTKQNQVAAGKSTVPKKKYTAAKQSKEKSANIIKEKKSKSIKLESLDDHAFASILQTGDIIPEKVVKKKSKKKPPASAVPAVMTTSVGVTASFKDDKTGIVEADNVAKVDSGSGLVEPKVLVMEPDVVAKMEPVAKTLEQEARSEVTVKEELSIKNESFKPESTQKAAGKSTKQKVKHRHSISESEPEEHGRLVVNEADDQGRSALNENKKAKRSQKKSPKTPKVKKGGKHVVSSPDPSTSFESIIDMKEDEDVSSNDHDIAQLAMKLKTSKEKKAIKRKKKGIDTTVKEKKKRPPSAYTTFCSAYRAKVLQESPGIEFAQMSRALGDMWNGLTEKDKLWWRNKARKGANQGQGSTIISTGKAGSSRTGPPHHVGVRHGAASKSSSTRAKKAMSPPAVTPEPAEEAPLKIFGTDPVDVAAHLKLLGESLSIIGMRLQEHKGLIAVQGSLSVLLDSVLCAFGPLMCLTQVLPETDGCTQQTHTQTLDNIAYIMPGL